MGRVKCRSRRRVRGWIVTANGLLIGEVKCSKMYCADIAQLYEHTKGHSVVHFK